MLSNWLMDSNKPLSLGTGSPCGVAPSTLLSEARAARFGIRHPEFPQPAGFRRPTRTGRTHR